MDGMARPSSFTAQRGDRIERALAAGAPLHVAGAAGGVSARTVARWLERGKLVRRSLSAVPEPDDVEDSTLPADDGAIQRALLGSVLSAARHDWRAATWLLERRWPDRYARR
jgi:hypothetical protein